MPIGKLRIKNKGTYVCPRCSSELLSILNHPIKKNVVIETANCPQCNLVWQDQWLLTVLPSVAKK